jgi:hypothetical protein
MLDQAVVLSSGTLTARVQARRGLVLWTLGSYLPALDDARSAATVLRRAGDRLWTARALNTRALVYLSLGSTSRADADFAAAGQLFGETGQELEAVCASGFLGAALRAEAAGHPRQLLAACRQGLAVLDEHRHTLGASELRARATAHGAELAELAQRQALRARQPRLLLTWSERWRATALAVPPVRPYADANLNTDLAALRAVTKRLDTRDPEGAQNVPLKREQQRLEGAVRARTLQAHGGTGSDGAAFSPAVRFLGDGPLVIIPPGRLHTIPWPMLPALRDRVVSVAPSASAWMRADSAKPPARHHTTFIQGPGLSTEGAEIPAVAHLYDDVTVLTGKEATAENVLSALDGAWLAHVAAHGVFRADSPLFSALRMHDGRLTVYDFERLRRAPYRLVLSSCDSGVLAPAGAGELLGLVSSLLPLGTAGIVAAVVPINDRACVPVMIDLHQQLRAGQTFAESMCAVRRGHAADPVRHAAAMSLISFGAA